MGVMEALNVVFGNKGAKEFRVSAAFLPFVVQLT